MQALLAALHHFNRAKALATTWERRLCSYPEYVLGVLSDADIVESVQQLTEVRDPFTDFAHRSTRKAMGVVGQVIAVARASHVYSFHGCPRLGVQPGTDKLPHGCGRRWLSVILRVFKNVDQPLGSQGTIECCNMVVQDLAAVRVIQRTEFAGNNITCCGAELIN